MGIGTEKVIGGVFCIVHSEDTDHPLLQARIGSVQPNDDKYALFAAVEKPKRLAAHLCEGHVSSFQSKDESKKRYAGAIKIPSKPLILAFSGQPQLADEAICLAAPVFTGLMEIWEAAEIAMISDNEYFRAIQPFLRTGFHLA